MVAVESAGLSVEGDGDYDNLIPRAGSGLRDRKLGGSGRLLSANLNLSKRVSPVHALFPPSGVDFLFGQALWVGGCGGWSRSGLFPLHRAGRWDRIGIGVRVIFRFVGIAALSIPERGEFFRARLPRNRGRIDRFGYVIEIQIAHRNPSHFGDGVEQAHSDGASAGAGAGDLGFKAGEAG